MDIKKYDNVSNVMKEIVGGERMDFEQHTFKLSKKRIVATFKNGRFYLDSSNLFSLKFYLCFLIEDYDMEDEIICASFSKFERRETPLLELVSSLLRAYLEEYYLGVSTDALVDIEKEQMGTLIEELLNLESDIIIQKGIYSESEINEEH